MFLIDIKAYFWLFAGAVIIALPFLLLLAALGAITHGDVRFFHWVLRFPR